MAAALAEWERETLSQRITEGLGAARELLDSNPLQTISGLARDLQVSARTLSRAIKG